MADAARTDLAAEAHRLWTRAEKGALPEGVSVREERLRGLPVTAVEIAGGAGGKALGKPPGRYFSLTLPKYAGRGGADFERCVLALRTLIGRCLSRQPETALVAALGNPDITPDALGSLAAGSVLVTRHLKQRRDGDFAAFASVALCRPGVLGTSGIESAAQVRLLCEALKPELVVVIDALAGCEPEGLGRTVQVSDAGLAPGSGVGNDRPELSPAALGTAVLSLGIPTVVDAGLFGGEALGRMFVTPRDIDALVRDGARVIAYALNLALHPGLTIADVDTLAG
ncbi:MAG: GPR endopeptidase [Oscillospiraceae bacterium]|nr:GPR endopeptidase [Oscillospiraceae bacterium]